MSIIPGGKLDASQVKCKRAHGRMPGECAAKPALFLVEGENTKKGVRNLGLGRLAINQKAAVACTNATLGALHLNQ